MRALSQRLQQKVIATPEFVNKETADTTLSDWEVLQISDLNFSYPSRWGFSLKSLLITVRKGESLGIVGESGSGKSTLLDIILGLIEDYTGAIEIDGRELRSIRWAWQEQIGYVPQSVYLIDDTLRKNIALGIPEEQIDDTKIREVIQKAQLSDFVEALENGVHSVVGERGARISGGQQQRLGIARALYRNPTVLVLDEATSALDSETEAELMQTISKMHGEVTMLIIAHRVTTLRNCDQIVRLRDGRIVGQGSYEEMIGDA